MEQKLPYEQQLSEQWTDLPLPNEDTCWADMKRRLEEEEDDRPIIFWWRRGCALWGLLSVALLSIGWWAYQHYSPKTIDQARVTSSQPITNEKSPSSTSNKKRLNNSTREIATEQSDLIQPTNSTTDHQTKGRYDSITSFKDRVQQPVIQKELVKEKELNKKESHQTREKNKLRIQESKKSKRSLVAKSGIISYKKRYKETKNIENSNSKVSNNSEEENLKTQVEDTIQNILLDSVVKPVKDTVQKLSPVIRTDTLTPKKNLPKIDLAKKSSYFFSVGLSIHQQIPTAGQSFTPYNSLGRKGSLADYIPAPYIRFTKDNKWFVQAEFRYGAPVYSKSFIYNQNVNVDTSNNRVVTNSLSLRKTFYHQLPVSFHYFIKPGFTIGTGMVWNKFIGAIAEQELISRDRTTGVETLLGKGIIKDSLAQSFTKSFFQAHIEAQYQWKRLQMGARYNFGVQPFIKFSLPGLGEQSRKSNSLQVFFRYQIWRSIKPKKP